MRRLFLIRHAKSSWELSAQSDFDRPLNARGIRDTAAMCARLKARIPAIDAFFSSPAQRAKTTADAFAVFFGLAEKQLFFDKDLYLCSASFYHLFISTISDNFSTVAIFAHNPGITDFANTLTPALKTDNIPTCGIFAVAAATESWKNFAAAGKTLLFYDYPKAQ